MWVGRKVRLRPFRRGDLPSMVRWNNDPDLQYYVDSDLPKTLPECEAWFARNFPRLSYRLFAIEDDQGRLIGDLELDHISWRRREAELRIRIGEKERWNEGYGTDAVKTLLSLAFGPMGLRRLYLKVYRFNHRAIRCYEKNGFRREGLLRRRDGRNWKDILLMSIEAPHEGEIEAAAAAEEVSPPGERNRPSLRRRGSFLDGHDGGDRFVREADPRLDRRQQ